MDEVQPDSKLDEDGPQLLGLKRWLHLLVLAATVIAVLVIWMVQRKRKTPSATAAPETQDKSAENNNTKKKLEVNESEKVHTENLRQRIRVDGLSPWGGPPQKTTTPNDKLPEEWLNPVIAKKKSDTNDVFQSTTPSSTTETPTGKPSENVKPLDKTQPVDKNSQQQLPRVNKQLLEEIGNFNFSKEAIGSKEAKTEVNGGLNSNKQVNSSERRVSFGKTNDDDQKTPAIASSDEEFELLEAAAEREELVTSRNCLISESIVKNSALSNNLQNASTSRSHASALPVPVKGLVPKRVTGGGAERPVKSRLPAPKSRFKKSSNEYPSNKDNRPYNYSHSQ